MQQVQSGMRRARTSPRHKCWQAVTQAHANDAVCVQGVMAQARLHHTSRTVLIMPNVQPTPCEKGNPLLLTVLEHHELVPTAS